MSRMTFDIARLIPRYIYADKNGYALAKAIERAFQYVVDKVEDGIAALQDPDTMPEWALDRLAVEYNILYDFTAPVESKRDWIKNALPLYRLYGTPQAVCNYLSGYFDDVNLEENWQYGGDPFHFRVTVEGGWTPDKEIWAYKAIGAAKNVRSVLDGLRIGCQCDIGIRAEGDVLGHFAYPLTGTENWAGRWPDTNTTAIVGENDIEAAHADDTYATILYRLCGQDEI